MYWYDIVNWIVLSYFFILNGVYILMNILAYFNIRQYFRVTQVDEVKRIYTTRFYKPISILVPAHNEAKTIINTLNSLLAVEYPEFEIIIINDGSTDNTLEVLKEHLQLAQVPEAAEKKLPTSIIKAYYISQVHTQVVVIDKFNGGKADALNAGLNCSRYPLFCAVDSDSMLEKDGLLKVARPFVDNPLTIAVGGVVRIANGCTIKEGQVLKTGIPKNSWARFQVVEYLRAFLFGRMGWDAMNSLLIVSGAFGLFSKRAVIEVGGYRRRTVGEDMEIVVRLHRHMHERKKKYRISFVPDPICWTEAPENSALLARQRSRWQRGMAETMWRHKAMFFNPRYGWIGMFAFPYFVFFELLGSVVEFGGLCFFVWNLITGLTDWPFALVYFWVAVVLGVILSLFSVVLEELFFHRYIGWRQVLILAWYAVLENFFYRQLHSVWRIKGIWQFVTGNRSWGKMVRKGTPQSFGT